MANNLITGDLFQLSNVSGNQEILDVDGIMKINCSWDLMLKKVARENIYFQC
jgi:hypothetical protein